VKRFSCLILHIAKLMLKHILVFMADFEPLPATVMAGTFMAINHQSLESCSNPLQIREVF